MWTAVNAFDQYPCRACNGKGIVWGESSRGD